MSTLGTPENPLRVAVVGSGPAGFYAAEGLFAVADLAVEVDMIDRLPTPFGLVRAGVAPDHPKIKNVIKRYEKTATHDNFRFFGNVEVGKDVAPAELAERYHCVLYAYGASTDRQLGIPGEDLPGSHAATEFVAWYNAHPDYADYEFDLSCERVVVIGNGNVAADVARMLTLTRTELEETDTAEHAIEAIAGCSVKEIVVLGRRGPAQAAFTNPEVRELGELLDADIIIDPADVALDAVSAKFMESDEADLTNRKNMDSFTEFAQRPPEGKNKRVVLKFFRSPVAIEGDGRVERIVVGNNEIYEDHSGAMRARDTGERETLECGLVLRSIGYSGVEIEGIPHDHERGVVRNSEGRIQRREPPPDPRPVRDRLDQARPQRRHRNQQEGLAGDGRQPDRGPRRRQDPRARDRPRLASRSARRARRRLRQLRRLERDRRGRESQGRAARPAAGQVRPRRRDARRRKDSRAGLAVAADLRELESMIASALPGAEVEVIDEGGGDHLRAVVVSELFDGKTRIEQHRMVKAAVSERFDDGTIHALSVKTSVP